MALGLRLKIAVNEGGSREPSRRVGAIFLEPTPGKFAESEDARHVLDATSVSVEEPEDPLFTI